MVRSGVNPCEREEFLRTTFLVSTRDFPERRFPSDFSAHKAFGDVPRLQRWPKMELISPAT